jgi:hypothetical protein
MEHLRSVNSERILRELLMQNPSLALHEIRQAHPVFESMSVDHLSLRVAQLIGSETSPLAK